MTPLTLEDGIIIFLGLSTVITVLGFILLWKLEDIRQAIKERKVTP